MEEDVATEIVDTALSWINDQAFLTQSRCVDVFLDLFQATTDPFTAGATFALIAFLLAVLPANIHAAQEGVMLGGAPATPILPRVAIQALFIGLILWAGVLRSEWRVAQGAADGGRR